MHPDETHNEELNQAPLLKGLQSQLKLAGEKMDGVPAEYFEQMQAELSERLEEERLLDAAPSLKSAGRVFPFSIPQGYFQSLPEQVMRRLHRQGRVIPM
ncbi:MAG: hypothetical protein AAF804_06170, partial [Bacteroidota bacterium]